ncbi:hypothetical protein BC938DRAFT_481476 [Jimgerdemannia flammicorona]|uniref:TFIIS central domain-containing protein n=1 Tax=Jimgerdemannia flammicorona TaxID=994334 RepID=A0A433QG61_9FUNG|nr:hypothetical protein BC938DRAFT_481476 [Jimgerdemannia flammicorona]
MSQVSCVCLYPGCPNPARDGDDYCSDQCTVKDSENVLRRLAAKHTLQTQHVPQPHHHKDENRMSISEDDDEEEERHLRSQRRRSSTASAIRRLRTYSLTKRRSEEIPERSVTPPASSPLQLTPTISQEPAKLSPEHDPIRRNVIKNMADTLKKIVTEALEKDPELFASPIDSPTTPKTPWSDSPMAPMETQIQQKEGDKDTTESSKPASMPTSAIPSADELSDRLSRSIELAMFEQLADPNPSGAPKCGERYKGKFRSLLFNLKDKANEGLRLRVVTGELPPEELVRMSAEDMANPALKSMSEVLRKRSIKDSVLKTQPVVAFIKKTHKGEVYMSTEPTMAYEREEKENDRLPGLMEIDVEKVRLAEKENINSGPVVISPTTPTTRTDTLEEILARMGNGSGDEPTRKGKRASVDFPKEWQSEKKTRMSPKFDLDDDMFDLRSDSDEDMEDLRLRAKRKRDLSMQEDSTIIDKSSRSPNYTPYTPSPPNSSHTPNYSPPPSPSFPTGPIWRGKLQMAQVAQFEAVALQIGGRLNNGNDVSVMWEGVLSASTIAVEGRIPVDRVTDYLTQTQFSSTKELTLIEFRPVIEDSVVTGVNEAEVDGGFTEEGSDKIREAKMDDNSARFDTLLEYFSSRSRFGVVGVKHMPIVKDMYIVPLRKDAPLPDCLVTMEHQLVEGNRDRNMMLGIVVVNKKLPPSTKKSVRKPKEMRRDTKDMELSSESLFRDSPRDGETEDGEKTEGTMLDVEEEYVSQEPLEIAMNGLPMPNAPATNPTTINMPTVSMIPTPQLPAPAISTNLDPLLSQLLNNPDVLKLLSVTATGLNANAGSSPTSAAGIANPSLALNLSNILIPQPAQAPLQQYIPPMTAMPLPPQAGVYESTAPILPPISSSTSATVPPQYQAFYNQQQFENPASQAYDPANPSAPPAHSSPPAGLALSALSSFYDDPHTGHQDRSTLQNVWEEEWGWESRERGRDPRDRGYHPDDRERERDYRGRDRDRGYRGDGGRDGRDYHPYPPRDREREWGDEEEAGHRGRDEHWRGGSRNVRGGGEWRGRGRGGTRGGFEPRGGYPKRGRGRGRGGYEGW